MKDTPRLYPLNGRTSAYAGRADLVAKIDGVPYVVDFKTGTRPKRDPYYEWRLQTAAYRCGLAEYGVLGNAVLHLDKITGMPTWYDFSKTYLDDIQAWNYLILFYRAMIRGKFDPLKETPSVTSACSVLDKSGPLMWWAADCMVRYARKKVEEWYGDMIPATQVYAILEAAKHNYRKVSQEAMDIGTQVHACIEGFIRTGVEPKIEDERILAGFVAFLEWSDTVHLEVMAQEVVIYG